MKEINTKVCLLTKEAHKALRIFCATTDRKLVEVLSTAVFEYVKKGAK